MPGLAARYDREQEAIVVDGGGLLWFDGHGALIGARDRVAGTSLASLRAAVRRADHWLGVGEVHLTIFDVDQEHLRAEEDAFVGGPVEIEVLADRVLVTCTTVTSAGERFDQMEVTAQLAQALVRHKLLVVGLTVYEEKFQTVAHLTCEVRGRGRVLGDALRAGEDVLALWEATTGSGLSITTTVDLLRAERPELIVGQDESDWLEAKQAPYRLDETHQQLELAKDVAAMANGADGGLIVIGLATVRRGERDVISKVRPVPFALLDCSRYLRVIEKYLYPPPEGLKVELVKVDDDGGLLMILVPRQPAEARPVLVVGAVVDGRVVGSYVSVFKRRGDATTAAHPVALHSLIAAGRAALSQHDRDSE